LLLDPVVELCRRQGVTPLKSFLDNVFGILPNSCVTKRECKNPSLVTLGETFKTQFIPILGSAYEFFVSGSFTGGSNRSFAELVSKLTRHDASPFDWAHALEPVCLPLLELRANHSPNPAFRKSLNFGWNIGLEVGKVENVQSTAIRICCQSQESTTREVQASWRELLVKLDYKTYEPALRAMNRPSHDRTFGYS
jgi:hypothetical protein